MPPEIQRCLDHGEVVKFAVNSRRMIPSKSAWLGFLITFVWLSITFGVGYGLVWNPFFRALSGKDTLLYVNNIPETVSFDNLSTLIFPFIILSVFAIIGILGLVNLIYSTFSSGGWFVGTDKRLIHLRKGKLRSISWDQFTGYVIASGNMSKGNLMLNLQMKSYPPRGEWSNNKTNTLTEVRERFSSRVVAPESISIIGVPNVFDIEKFCRSRIELSKLQKS